MFLLSLLFHLVYLILLIIILVLVIRLQKQKELFENCFGMQYNGLPLLEHQHSPICASGTTQPLYQEGGCAQYDPQQQSVDYALQKHKKKWISAV
jgi:hypothetical protein